MTNILEYKFSDLYEMSSGISSKPEQAGHGSPFVSFSTVFNNFFLPDKLNDLMDTSEREQEIYSLKAGDILLTRTSETIDELGMSCVVLKDCPKATFSGFVKRLRPKQDKITYPRYMGFYLRSKFFRKTMTNNAVLTLRASLNEEIFSYLKLYLPDYETQKRIGDFLYSLNQNISLNNRMNAELETMAKTIYDYWFVQFDFPISKEQAKAMGKPKLEGKPFKASGGKMVWSEELKRPVPEVWGICKLGDVVKKTGTGLNPRDNFVLGQGNNFYVTIKSIEQGRIILNEKCDRIDDEALNIINERSDLKAGDILYTSIEPVGTTYLIREKPENWNINESVFTIRPDYEKVTSEFLYMFLSGDYIKAYTKNVSAGSIHKGVRHSTLKDCKFILPNSEVILAFTKIVKPILDGIDTFQKENQKLSELRDWLLPMLMNGQVRIKETTLSKTANAALSDSKPANPYFYQTQLIAAIVNASKKQGITHGEMTLAKYTYLVDKLYGVPTYFNYERLHLGPYPKEMKKIVNNKKFFKVQNNEVSVVPQEKEYNYQFQKQVEEAVAELAVIFNQYKGQERSHQTELLATVCKVVEDIKSTDLKAVRESMKNWPIDLTTSKFKNKGEKFGEGEAKQALLQVIERGWCKRLLESS